ncbi:MAG: sodium/proline symporter [Archaeoglobi archaeon]|nr:hypothetical protein [Candidatus Mnemosynella bozhongmuii]MDI3502628.1 sodium/proline symporter [Archaeoglobi archaeon]MDK2780988.1 sodium/proline symporter [Archaeoglobi archaeon]
MDLPIPSTTPEVTAATYISIFAFLLISMGISVYMMRKARSFEEWLVGHRDIGPAVTGFALVATWLSGWAIFGNAGLTYTYGWSGAWLVGMTNIMGISLAAVLGYRIRRYASLGARTVPEVLRLRFNSRAIQSLAAVAMTILLIVYSVGQYKAMATVWTATTGSSWMGSLIAVAVLIFIYIAVGGYAGTQYALFLQGIILTIVGWGIGIASLMLADPQRIVEAMSSEPFVAPGGEITPLSLGNYILPISPVYPAYDWIGVSAVLFMFLFMATGFPHNIARFLGIREIGKKEFVILMLCILIGSTTSLWVGVQGLAARTLWGSALMNSEYAPMFGDLASIKLAMAMGAPVAGALAAGVFAAAVSTISGMTMIMASSITRDLIHIYKPEIPQKTMLWLTRILLIPFIFIPLYWNLTGAPPVLSEFMAGAAVGQAGIFFFTVAVSMYWRRATKWGAISAILYGLVLTLLHPKALGKLVGLTHWGVWALLLIFGCAAVYFAVSLMTKPEEVKDLFS